MHQTRQYLETPRRRRGYLGKRRRPEIVTITVPRSKIGNAARLVLARQGVCDISCLMSTRFLYSAYRPLSPPLLDSQFDTRTWQRFAA
jgi:hypothetical protein